MKKTAIRHQIVDHQLRLGDASIHQVGDSREKYAQEYHYHNTLEVITIKQGWILGLVGGVVGKITEGMIVVVGNDVPHCVLRASTDCKVVLIHIPFELLKWDEERFPELSHGVDYIRNSKSGILYHDAHLVRAVSNLASKITSAEGFMRISLLMRLLHILSTTTPVSTILAEQHYVNVSKEKESAIDRTYSFVYEHYLRDFSLSEIAAYAGMNKSALCRSFKKSSGYTIWQFCNRLRIEYACNLLLTTNMTTLQVAYQSGFNSYAHFSTKFKKHTNLTPTQYRTGNVTNRSMT
ncbi:MAG: AraC family transcriptional regulator [Candidatus Limisoma sp.]